MNKLKDSVYRFVVLSVFCAGAIIAPFFTVLFTPNNVPISIFPPKISIIFGFLISYIFPITLVFYFAFKNDDKFVFKTLNNNEKIIILLCATGIVLAAISMPISYLPILCKYI
jgi:integral membrane sensor domain MASE1